MCINVLGMNHPAQTAPKKKRPHLKNAANQPATWAQNHPKDLTTTNASPSNGAPKTLATGTANTAMMKTKTESLICMTAALANAEPTPVSRITASQLKTMMTVSDGS